MKRMLKAVGNGLRNTYHWFRVHVWPMAEFVIGAHLIVDVAGWLGATILAFQAGHIALAVLAAVGTFLVFALGIAMALRGAQEMLAGDFRPFGIHPQVTLK